MRNGKFTNTIFLMVVGRSMEPTLDCVLSDSYVDDSPEKALACSPDNWVTPYPEYESGW